MLLLVFKEYCARHISFKDILFLLGWLIIYIPVLVVPFYVLRREYTVATMQLIVVLCAFYFLATFYLLKRNKLNAGFFWFFAIFFFSTTLWYLAGAATLLSWIVEANFKEIAIVLGQRFGKPISDFFEFYALKLGIILIIIAAVSAFGGRPIFRLYQRRHIFILFVCCMLIPFLAGLQTYNGDVRYYYAGWTILLLSITGIALDKTAQLYKLRFFLALSTFILLFINLFSLMYNVYLIKPVVSRQLGESRFYFSNRAFESAPEIFEKFIDNLADAPKNAALKTLVVTSGSPFRIYYEPLKFISFERGLPFLFEEKDSLNHVLNDNFYTVAPKIYDFILVGPTEDSWPDNGQKSIDGALHALCENSKDFVDGSGVIIFKIIARPKYKNYSFPERAGRNDYSFCLYKNAVKSKYSFKKTYH